MNLHELKMKKTVTLKSKIKNPLTYKTKNKEFFFTEIKIKKNQTYVNLKETIFLPDLNLKKQTYTPSIFSDCQSLQVIFDIIFK